MPRYISVLVAVFVTAVAVLVASGSPLPAHAVTTRTWTGGGLTKNFSTAGNWTPVGAPQNGDALVFPTPAAQFVTLQNDLVDLTVASIEFDALGTTLAGNRLGVSSEIKQTAQMDDYIDLPIALKADITLTATGASGRVFMRNRLQPLGTVAIDLAGHTLNKNGAGDMELNGDVIGGGVLSYNAGQSGTVVPLTYSGALRVAAGAELIIGELGGGLGYCGSAPNADLTLTGGKFTVTCAVTVNSVSGTGTVNVFSEGDSITVGGKAGARFDGAITGAAKGIVNCCTKGPWVYGGTSSLPWLMYVTNNRLTLAGGSLASFATLTVSGGGSIGGFGSFPDTLMYNAAAVFDTVDGEFGIARFPTLQTNDDVPVAFTIHGATPGAGFTQVQMSGQLDIAGAPLQLKFDSYVPPLGQSYTLFNGASAVLETFKNLPEGAQFTVGGFQFKITYKGGAGNDVVITRTGPASTPTTTATATPTATPTPGGVLGNRRFLPQVARD